MSGTTIVLALQQAQKLIAEDNFSGAIPHYTLALQYDPDNYIAQFNLACCYSETNNFYEAMKILSAIAAHKDTIPGYAAKFAQCETELTSLATEHLNKAIDLHEANELDAAIVEIQAAKKLLPRSISSSAIKQTINELALKIEWQKMAPLVLSDIITAKRLYAECKYSEALQLTNEICETFTVCASVLNQQEMLARNDAKELYSQAKRAFEYNNNRALQKKIGQMMPGFLSFVHNFEYESAIKALTEIKNLCDQITLHLDVEDMGYIHPDVMRNDLQHLHKLLCEYNMRRDTGARSLADNVVTGLQRLIDPLTREFLEESIIAATFVQWKKIDLCHDLTNLQTAITNYIKTHATHNNRLMVLVCMQSGLYVRNRDKEKIKQGIQDTIFNNLPIQNLPPIALQMFGPAQPIMLPSFTASSQFSTVPVATVVDPEEMAATGTLSTSGSSLKITAL